MRLCGHGSRPPAGRQGHSHVFWKMMRIDQFLYQPEKSLWKRALLFPFYLLSLPYGGAVRTRSFLYSLQLLKTRTLPCPVISVGNIAVGGTGKTPLVMALGKGLLSSGIRVAILSRGYKRTKTSEPVVSDGKTVFLSPEQSGDEPFLIAKACRGIPVLVGKNRFINGGIALQRFGVKGLLLDDGYQYLPLHRDINILLIDSTIGFGDHHLLPRGILREPLSHLRRADLFLINKAEEPAAYHLLEKKIHEICPGTRVFHSDYKPVDLVGPKEEQEGLDALKGKKILAFSGVANPISFFSLLRGCGMKVVAEAIFPDHYLYTTKDLSYIVEKAKGADGIVTTEKDMVKLKKLNIDHLPIRALRIEMKIWEEEEFFKRIISLF
jgi:tetraacyldisaccharide 4'-kinase